MAPEEGAVEFSLANRRKGLDSAAFGGGGQSLASLSDFGPLSFVWGFRVLFLGGVWGAIWEGSSEGASSFVSLLQPKLWVSSVPRSEALRMTSCVF